MKQPNWKKNIILFLTSQAITLFGSSLVQFAIVWYIALETQSGIMITLMTLCGFLPQVLISLFGGVWADRYNRKLLIIAADAGIALATLVLAFIVMYSHDFFLALLAVSAIRSVGAGIQTPAVNALIPQIVPREKLMKISGINGSVMSIINLVTPAVSGAVLSWGAIQYIMFIDVITAAIGITIFLLVPVAQHHKALQQQGGYFDDLKAGLRYSFGNKFLRQLLLVCSVFSFLIVPAALLNVLMVTRIFGDNYWYLTLNEMAFFVGALLGGLVIGSWGGFNNRLKTLGWGGIVAGLTTLAIGLVDIFWLYLLIMVITGFSVPFCNSPLMVLVQEKVEPDIQGRVFSLVQITATLIMPLGMAIFGPLADVIPIQWLMIGSGIALIFLTTIVFKWKSFYAEGLNTTAIPASDMP
ncbi:MAG: MFS transporter [Clostridiales bacterium]